MFAFVTLITYFATRTLDFIFVLLLIPMQCHSNLSRENVNRRRRIWLTLYVRTKSWNVLQIKFSPIYFCSDIKFFFKGTVLIVKEKFILCLFLFQKNCVSFFWFRPTLLLSFLGSGKFLNETNKINMKQNDEYFFSRNR